jgi:hypothetical protein
MQSEYNAASRAAARRVEEAPAEVRAPDERIAGLRARLKAEDPDMAPQIAITVIESALDGELHIERDRRETRQPHGRRTG